MTIQPRIIDVQEKKLVGEKLIMSLSADRTVELWRRFRPRIKEIQNAVSTELYSMQTYDALYFETFNPGKEFEKWAAVEVTDFMAIPQGLQSFTLPQGWYAIFHYKGSSTDTAIFQYIFGSWLPSSKYLLDGRPHFEVLGDKYKNASPDSEEEIYIPVKPRN